MSEARATCGGARRPRRAGEPASGAHANQHGEGNALHLVSAASVALLGGCRGPHSALDPAGPQAAHIGWLWWVLLLVCTIVFVAVMIALVLAIVRHHDAPDTKKPAPEVERRITRTIAVSIGITAVILLGLLVASVITDRRLGAIEREGALTISITGRQWWWDVRYEDDTPSNIVITANEIHVPVGQPVQLRLHSADVIHSFWVPNLHGKRDLIPGHENTLWIQADRPGVFEGQCAEFCGYQHAHMRLLVVAQPPEEFQRWLERQRQPAREPITPEQIRGREVLLQGTCLMCHTVRGTPAGSRAAPDLTHVASRRMLGSATLPNTRGHLAGWIVDPQGVKPGSLMPPQSLTPEDLHALLDYLESLE